MSTHPYAEVGRVPEETGRSAIEVDRLHTITAHLGQLISVVSPGGTILAQYGADTITGHPCESRIGRSMYELIHPEDKPAIEAWVTRLAAAPAGTQIEPIEARYQRAVGTWRVLRQHGKNLLRDPLVAGLLIETSDEGQRSRMPVAAARTLDRLADAADGVRMGFFEYDVVRDTVEASAECYLMRGLPPVPNKPDLLRRRMEGVHPDDIPVIAPQIQRAIDGLADGWEFELRLSKAGGGWLWVYHRAHTQGRDANGRALRIVGIVLDVDRRKRAEQQLAESEARYRTVIAMTPGFIHESYLADDGSLQIRWASEGFTRLLGWSIEEINERGGWDGLIATDFRTKAGARRAQVLAGIPVRAEVPLVSKFGTTLWFDATSFPLGPLTEGASRAMMGTFYEVTARKHAEDALSRTEERFRLAADAVRGIIYERDAGSRTLTCSGDLAALIGLGPEMSVMPITAWLDRLHPDDAVVYVRDRLGDDCADDESSGYRLRHCDGRYIDVLDRAVRIRDEAGAIVRVVGSVIDISVERRAERLLNEAEVLAEVGAAEYDVATRALVFTDETYRILGANRAHYRPELKSVLQFFTPDSRPLVQDAIRSALHNGSGYALDVRVIGEGGRSRWVRLRGRADVSEGKTIRLHGAIQDIDALKRTELRLKEKGDWLRISIEAAQLVAWRWIPESDRLIVEYRSPTFDPEIEIRPTLEDDLATVLAEDRAKLRSAIHAAYETGTPGSVECRAINKVGRPHWVRVSFVRAESHLGNFVIGSTADITATREAHDALRESESLLRSVAENSPDIVTILDADLRITFVNRPIRGESPERHVGQSVLDFITSDLADVEMRLRDLIATGRPFRIEARVLRLDGKEALFEHRAGPLRQNGRVSGVIIYSTDITERRSLEREIIEVASEEQRRIGGDLHDGLGQELTGIALMLGVLNRRASRGEVTSPHEIQEIIELVNAAIDTTRTLARGLSPVAIDGGGLVDALKALAARTRELFSLNVRFRSRLIAPVELSVEAAAQLYRIAQESLTNAARHAQAKKVTVRLVARGQQLTLSVTDDGVGFASRPSAGMGLKIMQYRAHMLEANLSIDAGPRGRGTRVACTLTQPDRSFGASEARHRYVEEALRA